MSNPSDTSGQARDTVEPSDDPAQRSLADALRVSFWVLKGVMLLLLVIYLFSGVFNVREQETAVRLRFGRIVGRPGAQVLEPGGPYLSLPYPLEQVVTIPTSPRQIELNTEFWYELKGADLGKTTSEAQAHAGPLNPEKDGSLLTGDAEIIHARWSVTYTVADPIRYLTNVKDEAIALRLVRTAAQQGAVYAVAGLTSDQMIRSQNISAAIVRAQEVLDRLDSGIRITSVSVKDPAFPLPVRSAVEEVLNAESVRAKLIDEAQERWGQVLVEAAGEAFEPLLLLIEQYELASASEDEEQMTQLASTLDDAFTNLGVQHGGSIVPIGGAVAELIHEAKTYRTEVVARIRGEAESFYSLLPQYRKNPRIVVNRLWQDAKQRILTGDIETMYLPQGQAYLEINRDPRVRQERERKRISQESPGQEYSR